MSTAYISIKEKIHQVACLILDQVDLKGEELIFISVELFKGNFSWFIESELKDILNKLKKEKAIEYEWLYRGLVNAPSYSSVDTSPDFDPNSFFGSELVNAGTINVNLQEELKHQYDFVGITCKPNRERLMGYLKETDQQKTEAYPRWEGDQILSYDRSKRVLLVDKNPFTIPIKPAPQREVLLALAVERYNSDGSWVTPGRWTEVLDREKKSCRGAEIPAFRNAYEHLKTQLEKSLQMIQIFEWENRAFRIRRQEVK